MSLSLSVTALRRPAGWLARLAGRTALALVAGAWVLCLAAWLTLHWWILPRLDDWRPRIEAQASRALGQPVQIGRIAVHSAGWVPSFVLHDVLLRDARGREVLRLPQVSAALSVPSLLALRLRFAQLLIEHARLEVRRDAQGHWHIAGLDVTSDGAALDGAAAADWLFEQHEIVVRGGLLRWVDEQRAAPALQLHDVLLVLRNQGRRHALRLDATPPADWGQRFSLRAQARSPLLGRAGDWQRWRGTLFADLPQADVARLRRQVDLPVDLQQGQAALRAWIDWDQGVPLALTLDAALRQVVVRLGDGLAPLANAEMPPALAQTPLADAQTPLADAQTPLANAQTPLALAELAGRVEAERTAGGVKLALHGLRFVTDRGVVWAPSELALQWRQTQTEIEAEPQTRDSTAANPPVIGGEISADRLDLAALAGLAEHLPISAGLRRLLRQWAPVGTVRPLQARWDGPLDAPRRYHVRARVSGLAVAAAPSPEPGAIGRPGWRGADIDLSATETGGQATLRLADGAVDLPGVFEQATVRLAHFSSQLSWRIEPARPAGTGAPLHGAGAKQADPPAPRIELAVRNARFDNDDARGVFNATWHSGAGAGHGKGGRLPGVLALSGTLAEGRASQVARYLPLAIDPATRAWVQRAVQAGELRDVAFRVQGDLWDFPYTHRRDGDFRIAGRVQDVTLAPLPSVPASADAAAWASPWPALTGVSGELVFERNGMQFQQARGRLWGLALDAVQGRIRELSAQPLLEIDGQASGPLADGLRLLNSTPLGGWTGDALAQASASGTADLTLALSIPLARPADAALQLSLQLPDNDLRLRPDAPLLPQARGRLDATQKSVQITALRTQLAGGEAQIDGGSQPDGSLRFTLTGSATADGLRRLAEPGPARRVAQRLQGQATYRAVLGLHDGQTEWQVASNLAGMAIDLPAPLRKAADTTLALRIGSTAWVEPRGAAPAAARPATTTADSRSAPAPAPDWLRIELGALQASLLIDRSQATPRLLRSALAYDSPLPEPVAGGRAVLLLPRLDLDAWRALDWAGAEPGAAPADPGWLPQSVQLKTAELLAGGRRLSGVTLALQRLSGLGGLGGLGGLAEEGWHIVGTSDQAAGTLDYREPRSAGPGAGLGSGPASSGRIKARLSRLSLPPAEAEGRPDTVASLLAPGPASVPALDIEIDDFELRGHKLGRLVVLAVNRPPAPGSDAAVRGDWQLKQLRLGNPDALLTATGHWAALASPVAGAAADVSAGGWPGTVPAPARHRMALDFRLDVADGGALLQRLGLGRAVKGSQGLIQGTLGWAGSPLAFDLPSLTGTLGLALGGGQFLKLDAGAARLLGVLSLQALPRRLLLDFRDVFQEGFAFDSLTGDLHIQQGVARTDNLRIRGLQATVLMDGSADIARETQDLRVVALPELNTASASLAYAAINPAVALGAFVGQWLLREPLRQVSAREFRITGAWADPQVERVERGLFDALPALAAFDAPSAAAAEAAVAAAGAASAARP